MADSELLTRCSYWEFLQDSLLLAGSIPSEIGNLVNLQVLCETRKNINNLGSITIHALIEL
jgi:hypothetical protein